jgi:hypothetical protein
VQHTDWLHVHQSAVNGTSIWLLEPTWFRTHRLIPDVSGLMMKVKLLFSLTKYHDISALEEFHEYRDREKGRQRHIHMSPHNSVGGHILENTALTLGVFTL